MKMLEAQIVRELLVEMPMRVHDVFSPEQRLESTIDRRGVQYFLQLRQLSVHCIHRISTPRADEVVGLFADARVEAGAELHL